MTFDEVMARMPGVYTEADRGQFEAAMQQTQAQNSASAAQQAAAAQARAQQMQQQLAQSGISPQMLQMFDQGGRGYGSQAQQPPPPPPQATTGGNMFGFGAGSPAEPAPQTTSATTGGSWGGSFNTGTSTPVGGWGTVNIPGNTSTADLAAFAAAHPDLANNWANAQANPNDLNSASILSHGSLNDYLVAAQTNYAAPNAGGNTGTTTTGAGNTATTGGNTTTTTTGGGTLPPATTGGGSTNPATGRPTITTGGGTTTTTGGGTTGGNTSTTAGLPHYSDLQQKYRDAHGGQDAGTGDDFNKWVSDSGLAPNGWDDPKTPANTGPTTVNGQRNLGAELGSIQQYLTPFAQTGYDNAAKFGQQYTNLNVNNYATALGGIAGPMRAAWNAANPGMAPLNQSLENTLNYVNNNYPQGTAATGYSAAQSAGSTAGPAASAALSPFSSNVTAERVGVPQIGGFGFGGGTGGGRGGFAGGNNAFPGGSYGNLPNRAGQMPQAANISQPQPMSGAMLGFKPPTQGREVTATQLDSPVSGNMDSLAQPNMPQATTGGNMLGSDQPQPVATTGGNMDSFAQRQMPQSSTGGNMMASAQLSPPQPGYGFGAGFAPDSGLRTAERNLGVGATPIQQTLEGQAQRGLELGGSLSPEEVRNSQQAAREGWGARGLINSNGAVAQEVLNRDSASRQREAERRGFAQQVDAAGFGQRQQGFQNALGFSDASRAYGQLGLQNNQLGLQAQLANQDTGLRAQLANQAAAQFYAGLGTSNNQFNAGQQNQMGQFNANLGQLNNQYNTGQANQAGQYNAGAVNNMNQFNQGLNFQGNQNMWNNALQYGQYQAGQAINPFGFAGALTGGQPDYTSALLGYGGDVYNTNYNAQQAAQISSGNNKAATTGSIIGTVGTVAAAKIMFMCIPEHEAIDTPRGPQAIEAVQPGDIITGYSGRPTEVLQVHAYKEDYKAERFLRFTLDDGGTLAVCDRHRIQFAPAMDWCEGNTFGLSGEGKTINKIEKFGGVRRSFDLLTTEGGYRMAGVPINSMIGEMAEFSKTLAEVS